MKLVALPSGESGGDSTAARYAALCARLDAFTEAVRRRHANGLNCRPQCDGCCHRQFGVFRLEASMMRRAFEALPADRRRQVEQRALSYEANPAAPTAPCVFIEAGQCEVYAARPIICRSQGLPLLSAEILSAQHLDWCPLNFEGFEPADFDAGAILNLDTVNRLLAALSIEFEQQAPIDSEEQRRLSMVDIVLRPSLCGSVSATQQG